MHVNKYSILFYFISWYDSGNAYPEISLICYGESIAYMQQKNIACKIMKISLIV